MRILDNLLISAYTHLSAPIWFVNCPPPRAFPTHSRVSNPVRELFLCGEAILARRITICSTRSVYIFFFDFVNDRNGHWHVLIFEQHQLGSQGPIHGVGLKNRAAYMYTSSFQ